MAQKAKTESKKKKLYASTPVWDCTDEPCHLMYSSFSSPFISKNFVFQLKKKKHLKNQPSTRRSFFLFQSFILQHYSEYIYWPNSEHEKKGGEER